MLAKLTSLFGSIRKTRYEKALKLVLDEHDKWTHNSKTGHCLDLTGANLEGAVFDEAELANASFVSADLKRASFESASMQMAIFRKSDLSEAIMSGSILDRIVFTKALFLKAEFLECVFHEAKFQQVDVTRTVFRKCRWPIHFQNVHKDNLVELKSALKLLNESITGWLTRYRAFSDTSLECNASVISHAENIRNGIKSLLERIDTV